MQQRSDEFYDDFWGWCLKTFQPLIITVSIPAVSIIGHKLGLDSEIANTLQKGITSITGNVHDGENTTDQIPDVVVEPPKPINYAREVAHNIPVVPPSKPDEVPQPIDKQDNILEWFDSLVYILIFLITIIIVNLGGDESDNKPSSSNDLTGRMPEDNQQEIGEQIEEIEIANVSETVIEVPVTEVVVEKQDAVQNPVSQVTEAIEPKKQTQTFWDQIDSTNKKDQNIQEQNKQAQNIDETKNRLIKSQQEQTQHQRHGKFELLDVSQEYSNNEYHKFSHLGLDEGETPISFKKPQNFLSDQK